MISYYENLGYDIPRYNRTNVKKNTVIIVKTDDLPKYSRCLVDKKCDKCGSVYKTKYCDAIKSNYCLDCMIKRKGKESPKWKGGRPKCEDCGKQLKNFYAKICLQCLGKRQKGKNNPNYNVNKTDEERINGRQYEEYYEWRKQVYERDKYKCQMCSNGGKINAHHIKNYSSNLKFRTDIDNGITLCEDCHNKFHEKYGIKNNNLKQLLEFKNEQ